MRLKWVLPVGRAFLSLARIWRTQQRLCMNRVISLLSVCCILLGYSLKPRLYGRVLGTVGSVRAIGLTISLPEYLMEFCKVTLTFEYVGKILWCDHSNESSLPVRIHGATYLSKFNKMKFGRNLLWANFDSERVNQKMDACTLKTRLTRERKIVLARILCCGDFIGLTGLTQGFIFTLIKKETKEGSALRMNWVIKGSV